MVKPEQGKFEEWLEITRSRFIQGAVTDGATVRSGQMLTVQGAASGHFVIEREGTLNVQGVLGGTFESEGHVLVAGVVNGGLPRSGSVAVAVGTLFNGTFAPDTQVLRDDGTLDRIDGNGQNDINIDGRASSYFRYDPSARLFRRLLP